jgi:hypothetical protein
MNSDQRIAHLQKGVLYEIIVLIIATSIFLYFLFIFFCKRAIFYFLKFHTIHCKKMGYLQNKSYLFIPLPIFNMLNSYKFRMNLANNRIRWEKKLSTNFSKFSIKKKKSFLCKHYFLQNNIVKFFSFCNRLLFSFFSSIWDSPQNLIELKKLKIIVYADIYILLQLKKLRIILCKNKYIYSLFYFLQKLFLILFYLILIFLTN